MSERQRLLCRWDVGSSDEEAGGEHEDRPDVACSPKYFMAVRANVDKLMQIKQLEESFSARFFFEARLIPSGKTHEEKKKEAARCFQFLKKNVEGEDVGAIPWANIDMANSKTKCRSRFTVENCLEEPTDESPKPKVWMDGSVVKMSWAKDLRFNEVMPGREGSSQRLPTGSRLEVSGPFGSSTYRGLLECRSAEADSGFKNNHVLHFLATQASENAGHSCLTSTVGAIAPEGKILAGLIRQRLKTTLKQATSGVSQFGFVPGRGTEEAICNALAHMDEARNRSAQYQRIAGEGPEHCSVIIVQGPYNVLKNVPCAPMARVKAEEAETEIAGDSERFKVIPGTSALLLQLHGGRLIVAKKQATMKEVAHAVRYVLSCPGAAVNIIHSGHNVPPILELLHRMGGKSFRALLQHEGLVAMLKAHVGSDINVRFIPIERSSWLRAEFNTVFSAVANIEYMIFCKFLWTVLAQDMGATPRVGCNVTRHHFVTRDNTLVAFTSDIISHVDASIKDNSFARAMEAIRASQCYRDDLPEQVIAGEFAEKLELKSFPFDCQELSVTLCLGVPCVKGKEQVHFQLPHEDESRVILNVFSLQNSWMRPERVFLKFDWTDKDKNWQGHQFPTVKISVYLQRKYGFYLWNVVLPMFLIASMSACSMSIHIDKVADRLSATLTLVLTAVAYKYITAQMVPTIGYNTWLDKYVLACFWFLVVIVLENCVAGRFDEQTEFEWFMLIGIMFIFTNIGFAIWAWILIAQATTRAKEGPGENVCCDGCFAAELSDDMTGDALCEF
ncbi:Cys-loop ligand-gated ion channel [Symbiodinium microadriaticum]|uniref:Cys-loop ligand-gated ion channel n=1 Tax=Symbiodinium microadriaticum TaxID=2951 RepID=A0A1Q9D439_SYMMI|nr:Cys-loop ligand-gated ion channel [Symbiodinium microadriaticum]